MGDRESLAGSGVCRIHSDHDFGLPLNEDAREIIVKWFIRNRRAAD